MKCIITICPNEKVKIERIVPFGRAYFVHQQATSGLVGLRQVPDETCSSHNQGFVGYDDLVKAKGVLDLIVELPSFQEDLGETVIGPGVSATSFYFFCDSYTNTEKFSRFSFLPSSCLSHSAPMGG